MKWIPKILSLVMLWGALGLTVIYIDPEMLKDIVLPNAYLPFFILLYVTIFYTLILVIHKAAGSFLLSSTVVIAIFLSMKGIMHIGLVFVILLTLVIESVYIYKRNEKNVSKNEQQDRGSSI